VCATQRRRRQKTLFPSRFAADARTPACFPAAAAVLHAVAPSRQSAELARRGREAARVVEASAHGSKPFAVGAPCCARHTRCAAARLLLAACVRPAGGGASLAPSRARARARARGAGGKARHTPAAVAIPKRT
jgi:hypothetical protein